MSEPLTAEEIKAMRKRCNEATPGPWERYGTIGKEPISVRACLGLDRVGRPVYGCIPQHTKDADFIAHARADLPRCLDEIERLQAELAALRQPVAVEAVAEEEMPKW